VASKKQRAGVARPSGDAGTWRRAGLAGRLAYLRAQGRDRKLALFACGCCRRVWHLLADGRSRAAVEALEKYADGLASDAELGQAAAAAGDANHTSVGKGPPAASHAALAVCRALAGDAKGAAGWAVYAVAAAATAGHEYGTPAWSAAYKAVYKAEQQAQKALLNEVTGDPFRQAASDSAWLTPAAVKLARSIHVEQSFDRLPALADALEEAGCTDAEVLSHLRGPGPHVRGCWAVDLLLGRD
jgi:hypothetical protein